MLKKYRLFICDETITLFFFYSSNKCDTYNNINSKNNTKWSEKHCSENLGGD